MSTHLTDKSSHFAAWSENRTTIKSSIGKWVGGDDISVRGYSLFNDLFNNISYMQMIVLNATGKRISSQLAKWLENNFMCMSYPDSRIWCNQVGALHGVMQTSPSAATALGSLAADSRIYGGSQTSESAMKYLQSAFSSFENGASISDIVNQAPLRNDRPAIIGFARPVIRDDERIGPHQAMSKTLGFEEGKYMQFALSLSRHLEENYSMGINIGGYTGAFMLDQGFTPREMYLIKNICVSSGVTACYSEFFEKSENSYLPQHCEDISYTGHSPRPLPTTNTKS